MLGAAPTMVLLLLVIAYGLLVRRPLERVLAERRARTTGAVEQARAAISDAEASLGLRGPPASAPGERFLPRGSGG